MIDLIDELTDDKLNEIYNLPIVERLKILGQNLKLLKEGNFDFDYKNTEDEYLRERLLNPKSMLQIFIDDDKLLNDKGYIKYLVKIERRKYLIETLQKAIYGYC